MKSSPVAVRRVLKVASKGNDKGYLGVLNQKERGERRGRPRKDRTEKLEELEKPVVTKPVPASIPNPCKPSVPDEPQPAEESSSLSRLGCLFQQLEKPSESSEKTKPSDTLNSTGLAKPGELNKLDFGFGLLSGQPESPGTSGFSSLGSLTSLQNTAKTPFVIPNLGGSKESNSELMLALPSLGETKPSSSSSTPFTIPNLGDTKLVSNPLTRFSIPTNLGTLANLHLDSTTPIANNPESVSQGGLTSLANLSLSKPSATYSQFSLLNLGLSQSSGSSLSSLANLHLSATAPGSSAFSIPDLGGTSSTGSVPVKANPSSQELMRGPSPELEIDLTTALKLNTSPLSREDVSPAPEQMHPETLILVDLTNLRSNLVSRTPSAFGKVVSKR